MRHILTVLAIAGLMLVGFGGVNKAAATPAWAFDNEDLHVNVPLANDLHIQYYSDTAMQLVQAWSDKFEHYTATPSQGQTVWDITWSTQGPPRAFCDTVHVGVQFRQNAQNWLRKRNIYWTLNGVPQNPQPPIPPINGPGFRVTPPEGPVSQVTWRIYNNGTVPLTIQNLQFRQSPVVTLLPQMLYNRLPGWSSPRPPIVVMPESFFDVFVEVELPQMPFFLMAQGRVETEGEWQGLFVQQHEHPITTQTPTVTTWGLLALALLMLGVGFAVVRRSRRAVA